MAYRFKLDESPDKGLRRIAREQFERAISELSPLDVEPTGVHESRKALKRLRALVRLVGPALGKKVASRRNAALREIARLLSDQRDQAVLSETIDKLDWSVDVETRAALQQLRDHLGKTPLDLKRPLNLDTAQRARLALLKEARHFSKSSFKSRGFEALRPGLHASYRSARRAMKSAYRTQTDDAFHDLRKTVQWHWRQMALLSRAWPEAFEARISAARELSLILGDDHDLAMLSLAASNAENLPASARAAIDRALRKEQRALRSAAEHRAARLFAESAGAFCARIEVYWSAGRRVTPLGGSKPANNLADPDNAPRQGGHIAAITAATSTSQRRA